MRSKVFTPLIVPEHIIVTQLLFRPFQHKSLSLTNRVAMAPMTRWKSPNSIPGEDVAAYYRRRAEGGVGFIITEGTTIDRAGSSNDARIPNFYSPESLAGWRRVVEEVHAAGSKIAPQIWHMGMVRAAGTGPRPEGKSDGPSGLSNKGEQVAEPMTDTDIADTIDAFAKAAAAAKEIGFDAVELHGAHGYLVDQFFWDRSNRRDDSFGGDLAGRTRFAAEVISAIRKRVGPDFVVIHRFSQWKQQDYSARLAETPAELETFLQPLVDAGADMFHCSTRRFWEPEFDGSSLNLAGWTKKLTGHPTITVGSVGLNQSDFTKRETEVAVGGLEDLEERLERDEFDLVAVGRALITNPDWSHHIRTGRLDALQPFSRAALETLV
jgi:2,4-dienoyl-CoA reductase-like NADH-dependent reductase (Old Yellow Enzyme family)